MSFIVRMVRLVNSKQQQQSTSSSIGRNLQRTGALGIASREQRGGSSLLTSGKNKKNLSMLVVGGGFLAFSLTDADLMTIVTHEQSTHVRQSTYHQVELKEVPRSLDPRYRSLQE